VGSSVAGTLRFGTNVELNAGNRRHRHCRPCLVEGTPSLVQGTAPDTKMKFNATLRVIISVSDPEWGPFWMNYKSLKRKIKSEIATAAATATAAVAVATSSSSSSSTLTPTATVDRLVKSAAEVEFFRVLRDELQKTSDFFSSAEELFRIRHRRVESAFIMLKKNPATSGKNNNWTFLLSACVAFYKDVLMLENFAITNYLAFGKILKKHDKASGYATREKFMRNVVGRQNFTHYPVVLELLGKAEALYFEIQQVPASVRPRALVLYAQPRPPPHSSRVPPLLSVSVFALCY